MKASNFRAKEGEANFGKPIKTEVVGGAHIACEIVTKTGDQFHMTLWPNGLPRHEDPPNALRFPHGLLRFGETIDQCAARLVYDQLGMSIDSVQVTDIDSYVDDNGHWHIEPVCLAEVKGPASVPKDASRIMSFVPADAPKMTFWTQTEFMEFVRAYAPETLA